MGVMNERASRPPDVEELLAHAEFVRGLAGALVADPARADDLAQEAFAVALATPPAHAGNLRAWFARLLRNLRRTSARADARRAARERGSGRRRVAPAAADVAAELEVQKRIVQAVLDLDEPFRTVIVLRFFRGLTPTEIGPMTGVPAKTVSSRIARALARLRNRLDRDHGGRRDVWRASLLPLIAARPAKAGLLLVTGGALVSGKLLAAVAAAAILVAAVAVGPSLLSSPETTPTPQPGVSAGTVPASAAAEPVAASSDPADASGPSGTAAAGVVERTPDAEWVLEVQARNALGRPYAGARAEFRDGSGRVLDAANTDAEGMAKLRVRGTGTLLVTDRRAVESARWEKLSSLEKPVRTIEVRIDDEEIFGGVVYGGIGGGARGLLGGRGGHRNLRAYGGGASTEQAVDLGLEWLKDRQEADGSYDGDLAQTALAVLAALGAGETHRYGRYRTTIARELRWLLDREAGTGFRGADAGARALAGVAFVEADALSRASKLRDAAERTVGGIAREAHATEDLDLVLETWALAVANGLELELPDRALDDRLDALLARTRGTADSAVLGGALFVRALARPDDRGRADFLADLARLGEHLPDPERPDAWAWHFGTLASFQAGGETWRTWNTAVRAAVEKTMERPKAGTSLWPPAGPRAASLGRTGTTALMTATMEVYYRYSRR